MGAFGLLDNHHNARFPVDRLAEAPPSLCVFALGKHGLLTPNASATLQIGSRGYRLVSREAGKIQIGDEVIAIRAHVALPLRVFVCGICDKDAYRLYNVGRWACRKCHRLDYASRHVHRSVPGLSRILWLRRRLGVEAKPFAPLPSGVRGKRASLAAEIMQLEQRLLGHLRHGVNDALERRRE